MKIQPIHETLTSSVNKKNSKGVTAEGNPIQYETNKWGQRATIEKQQTMWFLFNKSE